MSRVPDEPRSPRSELHHKIRNAFVTSTTSYFRAHPERLHDKVADEDVWNQLRLLEHVLKAVDEFDIVAKVPEGPAAP